MHAHAHAPESLPQVTRVLVLSHRDDQRARLVRDIEADGLGAVICEARDVEAANRFLSQGQAPHVLVIDAQSVREELQDTLRGWTQQTGRAIVVVSDTPEDAVLALSAGAVCATPSPRVDDLGAPAADHLRKAIAAAAVCTPVYRPPAALHTLPDLPFARAEQRIIAIAGGLGSAAALESLIAHLPPSVPGIIAMVDVPGEWVDALAARLNRVGVLDVAVASHGDPVMPGTVYLAPTDRQVSVNRSEHGFTVQVGPRLTASSRPAVFFREIATAAGSSALGVLLGSADTDAAEGLFALKQSGARTLAEDPESAVCGEALRAALNRGSVTELTHLRRLPWRILEEALVTALPG